MFCAQCGNKIEIEGARFCSNCGFNLSSTSVQQNAPFPAPAPAAVPVQVVAPAPVSKLKTDEQPTMNIQPNFEQVASTGVNMMRNNGAPAPVSIQDNQFKAKCEYCMTVFTYHQSNLGYRSWYRHGFVYCPVCRQPLRHSIDLLDRRYDVVVNADGSYSGIFR